MIMATGGYTLALFLGAQVELKSYEYVRNSHVDDKLGLFIYEDSLYINNREWLYIYHPQSDCGIRVAPTATTFRPSDQVYRIISIKLIPYELLEFMINELQSKDRKEFEIYKSKLKSTLQAMNVLIEALDE